MGLKRPLISAIHAIIIYIHGIYFLAFIGKVIVSSINLDGHGNFNVVQTHKYRYRGTLPFCSQNSLTWIFSVIKNVRLNPNMLGWVKGNVNTTKESWISWFYIMKHIKLNVVRFHNKSKSNPTAATKNEKLNKWMTQIFFWSKGKKWCDAIHKRALLCCNSRVLL